MDVLWHCSTNINYIAKNKVKPLKLSLTTKKITDSKLPSKWLKITIKMTITITISVPDFIRSILSYPTSAGEAPEEACLGDTDLYGNVQWSTMISRNVSPYPIYVHGEWTWKNMISMINHAEAWNFMTCWRSAQVHLRHHFFNVHSQLGQLPDGWLMAQHFVGPFLAWDTWLFVGALSWADRNPPKDGWFSIVMGQFTRG